MDNSDANAVASNVRSTSLWSTFWLKRFAIAVGSIGLWGCAGANVAVLSSELPVPLLEPIELNVGIRMTDELLAYEHTEEIKNNGKWRIELGSAQELMFDNLASGMFSQHEMITADGVPSNDVDALLIPSIQELQFAIPSQTKGDFFEVWIKYEFELLDPNGAQIAQFPLTAYGKANSRDFGFLEDTENGALGLAAKVALRDAMAFFALRFKRVPPIATWLQTGALPARPAATAVPAAQSSQPAGSSALSTAPGTAPSTTATGTPTTPTTSAPAAAPAAAQESTGAPQI